ncbi:GGDEF domain-containing protein [Marinicella gelatinilytica]|uniref:GGDEF domain-containing protein n=1 Tax=Marinicella gelatinilytica TaxID=2996017 RepID=UPI002260BC3A|nr:GGDEF domain-containing protein [Marinicella gelatinilytica]MCX7543912.1 GGDEF domain-containing protein [Marinicella gelatinilytica]
MNGQTKRTEQDIIVLGLIGIYIVFVGSIGAYRMWREEYAMMILDWSLVLASIVIFIYAWRGRNIRLSSYYVAVLAVIGVELTVALKGIGQIFWAYPAVALVFYLLPPKHAIILWTAGLVLLALQIMDASLIEIINISSTLIVTSMFCLLFAMKMTQQNENLRKMARQDIMTKVHNRRAFYEDLRRRKATHKNLTAIFIDLDNFKNVNDCLGHVEGDAVLTAATNLINDLLDCKHRLYRMGGDEFVVLVDQLNWHDVCQLSQSIHQQFADNPLAKKHQLTLSMAVASRQPNEPISDWLNRLDAALYDAKKNGRNQVIFLTDLG